MGRDKRRAKQELLCQQAQRKQGEKAREDRVILFNLSKTFYLTLAWLIGT